MSVALIRRRRSTALGAVVALALGAVVAGLGPTAGASAPTRDKATSLKLGYFDNVTHAPALVALEGGILEKKLGKKVSLDTAIFNAGPNEVQAILSGSIDAGYIGPSPTVTAFLQSRGAVQVVSGVASGGAFLVVKPSIKSPKQLKGKTIATPQLGNTQDVALRSYLKKKGLKTDTAGGGDVSVRPEDNAITLTAFQQGDVDGAWVPEPWATRLVKEGGGKVLVDEADLHPDGEFATTDLIVRTAYLKANPGIVQKLLTANLEAINLIEKQPARAQKLVADKINADTSKPLAANLISASFKSVHFTPDPIASSLVASAKAAVKLRLPGARALGSGDVGRLYNLKLLNKVLKAANQTTISVP